jgi:hypothetical protein
LANLADFPEKLEGELITKTHPLIISPYADTAMLDVSLA